MILTHNSSNNIGFTKVTKLDDFEKKKITGYPNCWSSGVRILRGLRSNPLSQENVEPLGQVPLRAITLSGVIPIIANLR